MRKSLLAHWLGGAALGALALPAVAPHAYAAHTAHGIKAIGHIIVIYEENHPFDGYFGNFPGADGLSNITPRNTQVNENGVRYAHMPTIFNTNTGTPDPNFPTNLPNAPFNLNHDYGGTTHGYTLTQVMGDLVHRYYQEQIQIDGGRMDRFALVSDAGGLSMGYNDISSTFLCMLGI